MMDLPGRLIRIFGRIFEAGHGWLGLTGMILLLAGGVPGVALAAEAGAAEAGAAPVDGGALGLAWVLPFAGILLSIAVLPLVVPGIWHRHFGKIAAGWALAFIIPFAWRFGPGVAMTGVLHTALLEYIPFIVLLAVLFITVGGVRVTGTLRGTPAVNTTILAIGTALASIMGTTGAAMLLIRPLLRAGEHRRYRVHTVVFFIFLVANIGGSLTPLGDPPLFLGFLMGVDFFWPVRHLLPVTLAVAVPLLVVYGVVDTVLFRREPPLPPVVDYQRPGLEGGVNLLLLPGVMAAVLLQGTWKPGVTLMVYHVPVPLEMVVTQILLAAIAAASLRLTSASSRQLNGFSWGPIVEVGKLFAAIFLTMIPAIAMLRAGTGGALGAVVASVTTPDGQPIDAMYFWASGLLSSFLDNAPTYVVFFNTAGGDPGVLMGERASTLVAVSCGSVFMGANSYIGNAPNFMVKAIAEERGVAMPGFFGYMVWSVGILVPLFGLLTLVFFR
jgi:Na+/H+ antiporter NhaD/arsenite permease-like protein